MIEKSDELLYVFFQSLNSEERKDIGLMGGWAVHYTLKNNGVEHMGSRDIDIFFDPTKITLRSVEENLRRMGFHPHSTFRWARYFDSETERELSLIETKTHPFHFTSIIYVDIATPIKMEHVMPEPLLKKVFEKERAYIQINDIQIMVPSSKILIQMKLKSTPERRDSFKRTKDIADLYALLNSDPRSWLIENGHRIRTKGLNKKAVQKFKEKLERFTIDGTISNASTMLKTDPNKVIDLLQKL